MRVQRGHPQHLLGVEITPMIDVVFLLIIFFMTTAQFGRLSRADVDLPRERGEQEPQPEEAGLVINLTADGRFIVSSETLTLRELRQRARKHVAAQPDPLRVKLIIRADRAADSAVLNDLVEMLQELGLGAARLATEVPR